MQDRRTDSPRPRIPDKIVRVLTKLLRYLRGGFTFLASSQAEGRQDKLGYKNQNFKNIMNFFHLSLLIRNSETARRLLCIMQPLRPGAFSLPVKTNTCSFMLS